jgi:hypothetical protein
MKNANPMKFVAALILGSSLLVGGCKKAPAPAAGVPNSDGSVTNPDGSITFPKGTTPPTAAAAPVPASPTPMAVRNPDGSITNPDGSVTYPAGSSVAQKENAPAAAPAPSPATTSTPAPVASAPPPPPPAPVLKTVRAGARVVVRVNQGLAASRNEVGDSWSGVLEEGLTTTGGGTVFARGTPVSGTVIASKGKGRFKGAGALGIEVTAIGREHVSTSEYEVENKGRGKRTAGFIGGGGGIGALIGGLAGGGKGALIGGLAGAGAGTAAGAYTGNRDVVIPAESRITFRLTNSISVR